MKLTPYVERLNNSNQFKDFNKKNEDAFIIAGFFILDYEAGKNVHQIDYYLPSKKKVAAFTLDGQITMQLLSLLNEKVPEKLDIKTKVDLDQLKGILEDEMKNRNITDEIRKVIAVLQCIDGKRIWNLNCILTGMGVLNAHIEDESRSVLKMEKRSFTDIMKKIPASQLMPQQLQTLQSSQEASPEQSQEKLKQLEKLKQEIEKEEEEIQNLSKNKAGQKQKDKNQQASALKIQEQLNKSLANAESAKPAKSKTSKRK